MEHVMDDLKLAEIKKESLHKCLDQLHAQASSILSFTLEWKDLEAHRESTKASLLRKMEELALLEKKNVEMLKFVEESEEEVEIKAKIYEIEKEKHLNSLEKTLDERLKNLGMKERQFEERVKEIELKEKQLRSMQQSVEKYRKEVELKEKQLGNNLNL